MNRAELHRLVAGLIPCDATTASIVARRVVDAVLPQITTVEELEALTGLAVVLLPPPSSQTYRAGAIGWTQAELDEHGPLTVVWQPA